MGVTWITTRRPLWLLLLALPFLLSPLAASAQTTAMISRACGIPPQFRGGEPPPPCAVSQDLAIGSPCTCQGRDGQPVQGQVAGPACGMPPPSRGEFPAPPCALSRPLPLGSAC